MYNYILCREINKLFTNLKYIKLDFLNETSVFPRKKLWINWNTHFSYIALKSIFKANNVFVLKKYSKSSESKNKNKKHFCSFF